MVLLDIMDGKKGCLEGCHDGFVMIGLWAFGRWCLVPNYLSVP